MASTGDKIASLGGLLGLIPGAQPFAIGAGVLGGVLNMSQTQDKSYTVPNVPIMAMGGRMGAAKVEKGEVVDPPNGKAVEIGGGTHESGNDTTIVAPEGTDVYSDRIEIDGKSLAERKKARDRRLKKIQGKMGGIAEKMEGRGVDAIGKKSDEREFEILLADMIKEMFEEQQDQQLQAVASQENEGAVEGVTEGAMPEMAYGGKVKKYPYGTGPLGLDPSVLAQLMGQGVQDANMAVGIAGQHGNVGQGNVPAPANLHRGSGGVAAAPTAQAGVPWQPRRDSASLDGQAFDFSGGGAGGGSEDPSLLNPWSKAGNMANIFGPTALTLTHMLGSSKNPNYMAGFGADALRTQGRQFGSAAATRDAQLRDIGRSEAGQRARNQANTRGISQARAMDMATTGQAQAARQGARANYGDRISQLFGQRAQMELQVDGQRRRGAAQADISDRQDRAGYANTLAKNITEGGAQAQHYGKMSDLAKALKSRGLAELMNMSIFG